jgi:hypothetical protein
MPSFAVSISVLALVQAAVVVLARPRAFVVLAPLARRRWALIPAASVVAVVVGVRTVSPAAAGLTYLALIAVPLLAVVTLAWTARGARAPLALGVAPLFALAWADRQQLPGQAAALTLTALACVTLGALLAAVLSPRWLKLGIVLMAAVDVALVLSDLLQAPNEVLNAAAPAGGLPRLQEALFGRAVMGFGDLFIAAALGALLAGGAVTQARAALLSGALALLFNLLFFFVDELPATVPVAASLIILELMARRPARTRPASGSAPLRVTPARPGGYESKR